MSLVVYVIMCLFLPVPCPISLGPCAPGPFRASTDPVALQSREVRQESRLTTSHSLIAERQQLTSGSRVDIQSHESVQAGEHATTCG